MQTRLLHGVGAYGLHVSYDPLTETPFQNICFKRSEITVPCGKCINCLVRAQRDYSYQLFREATHIGNVTFLTLTYRPDCLPLVAWKCDVDTDTGELVRDYSSHVFRLGSSSSLWPAREYVREHPKFKKNEFYVYSSSDDIVFGCCPTLYREDVKSWLKTARIQYEREFGYKLKFRYFVTGEYGFKTDRPHYHMLIFGLSEHDVDYLARCWRRRFGKCDVRKVKNVVTKNKNSYQAVGNYVAKYLCKGEFDSSLCSLGFAQKPRKQSSRDLGQVERELDALRNYHCCFDLFGKFDINNVPDNLKNNEQFLEEVHNRLSSSLTVGKQTYQLPRYAKRKVFGYLSPVYTCYETKKVSYKYSSSELLWLLNDYERARHQRDFDEKVSRYLEAHPGFLVDSAILAVEVAERRSAFCLASCRRKKLREHYQNTIN